MQVLMCIVCYQQLFACAVYMFWRKAMAHLTDVIVHTDTHTHAFKLVATRLLLPRRQINAVRTQCRCNVFVYFTSESLAPPEQTDRQTPPPITTTTSPSIPSSVFSLLIRVAMFPEGLRCGNFFLFSSLSFFLPPSLSLSRLLLLFAQALNVLVQTLFPPAGRAAPYARPVKAAVVMDTGKRQKIKWAPLIPEEVSLSIRVLCFFLFLASRPPGPVLFSSKKKHLWSCCVVLYACVCVFPSSPTWCSWAWKIQAMRRCWAAAVVVAAVHNVLFCQALSSICSWRIGVKLLAQLPPYLWSWSSLVTRIQYTPPGGRESVMPSNPREINYATSQSLWFVASQCLANTSKGADDKFYNLLIWVSWFIQSVNSCELISAGRSLFLYLSIFLSIHHSSSAHKHS